MACGDCNDTGVWHTPDGWRELGLCHWCMGKKTMWGRGDKPCIGCLGTGLSQVARSIAQRAAI